MSYDLPTAPPPHRDASRADMRPPHATASPLPSAKTTVSDSSALRADGHPAGPPLRLQLRAYHPVSAELARRLGRGLQWLIDDEDSDWHGVELTLAPTDHWPCGPGMERHAIQWRTRHGLIEIEDPLLLTLLTGLHLPADAGEGLSHELLQWACGYMPAELQEVLGGPLALVPPTATVMASALATPSHSALLSFLNRTGEPHTFLIRTDAHTLQRWISDARWHPPTTTRDTLPRPVRSISLEGGLWLGSLSLSAQRLARIRPGDALTLPSEWGADSSSIRLLLGATLVNLRQTEDGFYQFQGWGPRRVGPSNPFHQHASALPPLSVDALKVEIDVLVGHLSMTVEALAALAPGQILPLDVPTPPRVRIVANGQSLGAGELVEVGQRLAVEITEWGHP
ncbi:FliM/FliN family flagellar motor switch protein [Roseateles amylovorans]|uniref:FliM/FliN family flagellar motor switch protein n=1 Tax=Roseateles amylovorans TaxID=2978473 RepID=A0ABY6B3L3_9BURK|nr:FliM/FliN family flagellar motor switch protein [Roseateles amylovorans]UXH79519.1 FliM/FliN family flagellar motor switch protein [Roseateles amylovorans]